MRTPNSLPISRAPATDKKLVPELLQTIAQSLSELSTRFQELRIAVSQSANSPKLDHGVITSLRVTTQPTERLDIKIPEEEYVVTASPQKGSIERLCKGLVGYRADKELGEDRFVLSRAVLHAKGQFDRRYDLTITVDIQQSTLANSTDSSRSLPPLAQLITSSDQQQMLSRVDALLAAMAKGTSQKNNSSQLTEAIFYLQELVHSAPSAGSDTLSDTLANSIQENKKTWLKQQIIYNI